MSKTEVYYQTRVMCSKRNLETATHPGEIAYWRGRLIADNKQLEESRNEAK